MASSKTILFLHGYTQNASLFRAKTSALRKKLMKMGFNCVYLDAPYVLTPADLPVSDDSLFRFDSISSKEKEDSVVYRGWWIKPNQGNDCVDIDESIHAVRKYIENKETVDDDARGDEHSDVVGIIGFSQGASFAGLIAHKFQTLFKTKIPLKFVILYSGFKLDTSKKSGNEKYDSYYPKSQEDLESSKLRYLHVYGELDTVVDETRNLTLYDITKNSSDLLKHPGGHFVPNSKLFIDQVTNWIHDVMEVEEKKKKTNKKSEQESVEKEKDDIDALLEMMDGFGKA
ncbi:FSH3 [Candida oxycetoniae]|uniref:FSH3 n=1 Tax=Candida oxycetoniae TaxID=497107 RepID=A0AAI9WXA4_9ASCO|nr:FSH3 [Candida oxycetoniae]KAI3403550.2 FSH3 [Candida oxycetoniae]